MFHHYLKMRAINCLPNLLLFHLQIYHQVKLPLIQPVKNYPIKFHQRNGSCTRTQRSFKMFKQLISFAQNVSLMNKGWCNKVQGLGFINVDVPSKHRKKYVQFLSICHLLTHGHPMTNYEDMPSLFHILKVKCVSRKH